MTAFALKLAALTTMLIDHAGAVFQPLYNTLLLREIGRISFPLFAFLAAEGCRFTKDIRKYISRLFLFALISEIPYDILFENLRLRNTSVSIFLSFRAQNVIITLTLGVVAVYAYQLISEKRPRDTWLGLFCVAGIASLGSLLRTDYGTTGVVMVFALYIAPKRYLRVLAMSAILVLLYLKNFSMHSIRLTAFSLISIIFILLYNGKRGPRLQWFFYAAYPLHLLLLAVLWFLYAAPQQA